MKPFQRAVIPPEEINSLIWELSTRYRSGDEYLTKTFKCWDDLEKHIHDEAKQAVIFKNDIYQVDVREKEDGVVWLSIKRIDRQCIHDWRELQEIKNALVGEECEGVELYPAESRLVDTANQYHLWCIKDEKFRFPFGFTERYVSDIPVGKSVNRKFQ